MKSKFLFFNKSNTGLSNESNTGSDYCKYSYFNNNKNIYYYILLIKLIYNV